ncbi:MAG: hypothetical protein B7Z73_09345 [Planctomycetia bacterium 21-64-5]|nr:MAG: hypothetical protein B7Z73_09345 [Planctomycetia bacterium 21-64-5]
MNSVAGIPASPRSMHANAMADVHALSSPARNDVQTAFALHQAERYAAAAGAYQALLDRDPTDPTVLHLFGVMHQQCGHSQRATELIGRAIELRPDAAPYHANLAEALRALGRYEEAAESCRAALRLRPDYPEALNNLGLALYELRRYDEALAQYDAALEQRPNFAMAQNNRGTALVGMGEKERAAEAYRAALELDPKLALAHANLGQLLADDGKLLEGLAHCREAVRHGPALPAAHNNLGNVLRALERWAEAGEAYAEAVRVQPDLAVAHANAGLTLLRQGKAADALKCFQRASELAPDDPDVWRQVGQAYAEADEWAPAIDCCRKWIELKPRDADAHNSLGWACQSEGRHHEAAAAYRRTLELSPDHLDALLNLGSLHEELGAMSEAETCFRQAETGHPRSPMPLARRAMPARGRLSEADRDRLRTELYRPCARVARMNLLYALAHVADARGDYAEAAACLEPANALAHEQRRSRYETYDRDEHSRYVERLMAAFTPEVFQRLAGAGHETAQPVFVFGMARSGTTLVEQVLASHSQVFGAGELSFARRAMNTLPPAPEQPGDMAACLAGLNGADVRRLAQGYLDAVEELIDCERAERVPAHRDCPRNGGPG